MPQQVKIICPICEKNNVPALFFPSTLQIKTARGSGQSGKITFRTEERYEVQGDCPDCGAKKSVINKVLTGRLTIEETKSGKKKKKCSFCKESFEGPGKICTQCAEWED